MIALLIYGAARQAWIDNLEAMRAGLATRLMQPQALAVHLFLARHGTWSQAGGWALGQP